MWSVNPAWTSLLSALPLLLQKSETYNSVQCRLCVKVVFMLISYREFVSLVMTKMAICKWFGNKFLFFFNSPSKLTFWITYIYSEFVQHHAPLHEEMMLNLGNIPGFVTCLQRLLWLGSILSTSETTKELKISYLNPPWSFPITHFLSHLGILWTQWSAESTKLNSVTTTGHTQNLTGVEDMPAT
jgi:hypothetical protein